MSIINEGGNAENKAKKNAHIEKTTGEIGIRKRVSYRIAQGSTNGDLKKIRDISVAKHAIKKAMKESKEHNTALIAAIANGDLEMADTLLQQVLDLKVNSALDAARADVAENLFNTEDVEVIDAETYEALSDEEKADWEEIEVELEEETLEEGSAENKAKKNAYYDKKGASAKGGWRDRGSQRRRDGHVVKVEDKIKAKFDSLASDKGALKRHIIRGKMGAVSDNMIKAVARKTNEEVEHITEISADTLKSYASKASADATRMSGEAKRRFAAGDEQGGKAWRKMAVKRRQHVDDASKAATFKSMREETITELEKKTLKSYVKKATTSAERNRAKGEKEEDKSMSIDGNKYPEKQERHQKNAIKAYDKQMKREKGIQTAKSKLADK